VTPRLACATAVSALRGRAMVVEGAAEQARVGRVP
jgi:hypothetical protein